MELHLKIKELLKGKKYLEQKDLAEILGVSPKQAHNYLNGHSKIIADHIPAIAKLLGVSINSLFENIDKPDIACEEKQVYKVSLIDCMECIKKQKEIDRLNDQLNDKTELLDFYRGKKETQTEDCTQVRQFTKQTKKT